MGITAATLTFYLLNTTFITLAGGSWFSPAWSTVSRRIFIQDQVACVWLNSYLKEKESTLQFMSFPGWNSVWSIFCSCRPFDWLVLRKFRLQWHPAYGRNGSPVSCFPINRCLFIPKQNIRDSNHVESFLRCNNGLFKFTRLFYRGSGEAAVPERNPSSAPRPRMALPLRRKGEEGAEQRKVSGQWGVTLTSSSLLHDVF